MHAQQCTVSSTFAANAYRFAENSRERRRLRARCWRKYQFAPWAELVQIAYMRSLTDEQRRESAVQGHLPELRRPVSGESLGWVSRPVSITPDDDGRFATIACSPAGANPLRSEESST